MDEDLALALQLSQQINENEDFRVTTADEAEKLLQHNRNREALSITDSSWEFIDPIPNIHDLFIQFNAAYFDGVLAGVEVKWSSRMTLCAGVCCYEGRGGLCSVKLSAPLLKLRPRSDLINTLLHEMIHALLFVTDNNKDHDGHGAEFHKHMYRINKQTGSNITVYHTFHDEVNNYRQHWWRCDGPCVKRPPFYGIVKRAMNRAPGPRDPWHKDHMTKCGGNFIKIKEPEKSVKTKKEKKTENGDSSSNSDTVKKPKTKIDKNTKSITDFFNKTHRKEDPSNKMIDGLDSKLKSKHGDLLKNSSFWNNNTSKSNVKGFQGSNDSVDSSNVYAGSSKNASSNIHGFKMSANKKTENNINTFSGNGFKIRETATISSRESFLKKMEADISCSKKRKLNSNIENKFSIDEKRSNYDKAETKDMWSIQKPSKSNKIPITVNTENNKPIIKFNRDNGGEMSANDQIGSSRTRIDTSSESNYNRHANHSKIETSRTCINTSSESNDSSHVNHSETRSNGRSSISEIITLDDSMEVDITKGILVECPACPAKIPEHDLNRHLDTCLASGWV